MASPASNIRNFSIIAHIDHGKSTLADRILEITGAVDARDHRPQLLDSMELERERGITIKAQAVRVEYTARDGQLYRLHLIDTPGHVDFTYEVSRSLAACDGALLLVDASQGVEAQTVANTYLAVDAGLELIPALNKIDLPGAEPERVAGEITELIGEDADEVLRISAKTGEGVTELLEAIVARVPPPEGDSDAPARALIFDSEFDQYRGVIAYVRVVDGELTKGDAILAMQTGTEADDRRDRLLRPADDAGRHAARRRGGLRDHGDQGRVAPARGRHAHHGARARRREPLPGYREVKPMVFCGLFPVETEPVPRAARRAREAVAERRRALLGARDQRGARLRLPLRLPRPAPHGHRARAARARVRPRAARHDADRRVRGARSPTAARWSVHSPTDMPDRAAIEAIREPYIRATILCPKEHVGAVMELCQERRGTHVDMTFLSQERVQLHYDLPLAEIVLDFFDQLKSRTQGYASLDYELIGMREGDLVKLDILLAGDKVDALSMVVHRDKAYAGRPRPHRAPAQADPAPAVRGRDPGGDRRQDHRARVGEADAQGRDRQVLRRRHHAQAQAAREAEGGQEADEAGRAGSRCPRRPSSRCSS